MMESPRLVSTESPRLFIIESPVQTAQLGIAYADGRRVTRNVTPLTERRLRDVFDATNLPFYLSREEKIERIRIGIRALQSLDDLGEDANRELARIGQDLFRRLEFFQTGR